LASPPAFFARFLFTLPTFLRSTFAASDRCFQNYFFLTSVVFFHFSPNPGIQRSSTPSAPPIPLATFPPSGLSALRGPLMGTVLGHVLEASTTPPTHTVLSQSFAIYPRIIRSPLRCRPPSHRPSFPSPVLPVIGSDLSSLPHFPLQRLPRDEAQLVSPAVSWQFPRGTQFTHTPPKSSPSPPFFFTPGSKWYPTTASFLFSFQFALPPPDILARPVLFFAYISFDFRESPIVITFPILC